MRWILDGVAEMDDVLMIISENGSRTGLFCLDLYLLPLFILYLIFSLSPHSRLDFLLAALAEKCFITCDQLYSIAVDFASPMFRADAIVKVIVSPCQLLCHLLLSV